MPDAADVSGLTRRWRADTIAQGNGTAVTSWTDSVGSIAVTQATSANQPSYITSGPANSQPCVRFDGSTDVLSGSGGSTQAQPVTIAIVAMVTAFDKQILHHGPDVIISLTGKVNGWAGTDLPSTESVTTSVPFTASVGFSGTNSYVTVNGGTPTTGNAGTTSLNTAPFLGKHASLSRYLPGDLYEVLIYNRLLNADERAVVDTYIQDRYAITVANYLTPSAVDPIRLPVQPIQVP